MSYLTVLPYKSQFIFKAPIPQLQPSLDTDSPVSMRARHRYLRLNHTFLPFGSDTTVSIAILPLIQLPADGSERLESVPLPECQSAGNARISRLFRPHAITFWTAIRQSRHAACAGTYRRAVCAARGSRASSARRGRARASPDRRRRRRRARAQASTAR